VRRWKYQPFKLNGKAIAAQTQVQVDFKTAVARVIPKKLSAQSVRDRVNARDQNKLSFLSGAKNPRTLHPAAPSNLSPGTDGIKGFWVEQRFSAA